jgi:hypothetical protein
MASPKITPMAGVSSKFSARSPNAVIGAKPKFTVAELMKRYPDGNIPDMPGAAEKRVRKLARRRLAAQGVVYKSDESGNSPNGGWHACSKVFCHAARR